MAPMDRIVGGGHDDWYTINKNLDSFCPIIFYNILLLKKKELNLVVNDYTSTWFNSKDL